MKHFLALLFAVTLFVSASAQSKTGIEQIVIVKGQKVSVEAVDLGLPSGTLWASCNIGAASPEAYGDYIAWGELLPKSHYTANTYMHLRPEGNNTPGQSYQADGPYLTAYQVLPLDIAGNSDYDAAYSRWGGNWRMPNLGHFDELRKHCKWEQAELNGVKGFKVISKKNGNRIFLPAANHQYENRQAVNTEFLGYYWTSTQSSDCSAWAIKFNEGRNTIQSYGTWFYYGMSIRPVYVVKKVKKNKK